MKSKYFKSLIFIFLLASFASCKKYLSINSSEATPQDPSVSSVFPTQLAGLPRGLQYDSRMVGKYIQNFGAVSSMLNWDNMGYDGSSDNDDDIERMTYFGLGQNLEFIIKKGIENAQWDYVGAAYALKALSFQYVTDECGEAIFTEAFPKDENIVKFKYDDQYVIYNGIDSLCRVALQYLQRTDLNPVAVRLRVGDYSYNGDVKLWQKLVYGILARNFHRTTNKSDYRADSVIKYCGLAMQTVAEDFVIPFDNLKNDDANFAGVFRDNYSNFRQSAYIVGLLDGSFIAGQKNMANRDPRIKHMLTASADTSGTGNGGYRGVAANVADPNYNANGTNRKAIPVLWADSIYTRASLISQRPGLFGRYVFSDKAVLPIMTSAEIRFIKAEALFIDNKKKEAWDAYKEAIGLHFDFINKDGWPRGNLSLYSQSPIPATERATYMAGLNVKQDFNSLTISDIMMQKYIALWGWGFFETWVDMRRYHYTDLEKESATGAQIYNGFTLPTLSSTNVGRPVYRLRPRYNSEYIWNLDEIQRLGGTNLNYHTYECWFSQQ